MTRRLTLALRQLNYLRVDAEYAYQRHWVEHPATSRWLANQLRNAIEEGTRAWFSENYTRIKNAQNELKNALGKTR